MDKLIADLMSTVAALTAAVERQSSLTERVVAGQEAAMAKLEGATTGAGATRRGRPPKNETVASDPVSAPATAAAAEPDPVHPLLLAPNGETAPAKNPRTGEMEDAPTGKYRAADFSLAQVKNEFAGWLGETDNADLRKERVGFVGELAQHFGVKLPFSPTDGLKDDDQRKQALFYMRRKRAGLPINFSQDYDFDIDPMHDSHGGATDTGADAMDALG